MKFRSNSEAIPYEQTEFQTTLQCVLAKIARDTLHDEERDCGYRRRRYLDQVDRINQLLEALAKSQYADYDATVIEAAKNFSMKESSYYLLSKAIGDKQPPSVLTYLHRVVGHLLPNQS